MPTSFNCSELPNSHGLAGEAAAKDGTDSPREQPLDRLHQDLRIQRGWMQAFDSFSARK